MNVILNKIMYIILSRTESNIITNILKYTVNEEELFVSCDQSNRRQTEEDQPPGFAGWLGKANEDNCVTLTRRWVL